MADEPEPTEERPSPTDVREATPESGSASEPTSERRSRARRIVFFSISAAFVVAVLIAFRSVLTPFVLAGVVAYVLYPAVRAAERVRVRGKPFPRWIAIIVIYLLLFGVVAGGGLAIAPRMKAELSRLGRELPGLVRDLKRDLMPTIEHWSRQVQDLVPGDANAGATRTPGAARDEHPGQARIVPRDGGGYDVVVSEEGVEIQELDEGHWRVAPAAPRLRDPGESVIPVDELVERALAMGQGQAAAVLDIVRRVVTDVVKGVFTFFLTLMLAAYVIISWDRIYDFFRSLVAPPSRESFDSLMKRLDRGLSGVVRGQLVICLVNGVLSGIGFYIADLKYWPVLTLIATAFSIIPIFGAILSSIPACAVAIGDGFGSFAFTLLWIIGIHQVEANVLNPKIMGDAAKIHPVLVVFSLLAGEWAFGILGALLAVPVLSICQSFFLHFKTVTLGPDTQPPGGSAPE
ncbi:MAG: AI-2E family transporter [Deltaproteobacteria bacterium]|nr:AI-2E family transporter [Deltaproteobacteria bacterium]